MIIRPRIVPPPEPTRPRHDREPADDLGEEPGREAGQDADRADQRVSF